MLDLFVYRILEVIMLHPCQNKEKLLKTFINKLDPILSNSDVLNF